MDVKPRVVAVAGCALLLFLARPYGGAVGQEISSSTVEQPFSLDCDPTLSDACASLRLRAGRKLFDVETFGGNGRTCRTCHSNRTGTFSPEDALARLAEDPTDPLSSCTMDSTMALWERAGSPNMRRSGSRSRCLQA